MDEATFRRNYQRRFQRENRGVLWRLPDSAPMAGPDGIIRSSGTRPCDLVGVKAGGRAIAIECKFQRGGKVFNMARHFRGRAHQLASLKEFSKMGGYAAVVLGWIPNGERRTQTFEWSIEEILRIRDEDDGKVQLS
jgi:Holliday junction resolvase